MVQPITQQGAADRVSFICLMPRGILPNKEVEGLGPHIKFGGKIWGKVRPSSPNKRKNLGSSVTTRRKSWEKVPILGSYLKFRGQKFGVFVTYIFGGKIWSSNKNFKGKFWGQAPRPPNMEVPPGVSCITPVTTSNQI